MATIDNLQPECGRVPDLSGDTTVRATKDQLRGCGKDDRPMTLYRLSNELPPTPLSGNYWHVRCGYRPATRNPKHTGILLCDTCAIKLGLPLLK
jgi:hypothetical protein